MHDETPQNNDSPPTSHASQESLARWLWLGMTGGLGLWLLSGLGIGGVASSQAAPEQHPDKRNRGKPVVPLPATGPNARRSPPPTTKTSPTKPYSSRTRGRQALFARPNAFQTAPLQRQPQHPLNASSVRWLSISPSFYSKAQRVHGQEKLKLSYRFRAALGVQRISLVFRNLASRHFNQLHRKVIQDYSTPQYQGQGSYTWMLSSLPFGSGDTIEYFVEVEGHTGMSCSKPAQTSRRYLQYDSPVEQHHSLLLGEKNVLKRLVHGLADRLETKAKNPRQWVAQLHRLQRNYQQLRPTLRSITRSLQSSPVAHSYAATAIDTLLLRMTQRSQHRTLWLTRCNTSKPKGCQKLWQSPQRHKQWEQAQRAHEDDVFAVRKLIHHQEMDLIDDLRSQLSRAHQKVRRLAIRHRLLHKASTKRALTGALQHMDRLLRQVQQIQ